ncbi:hypothetical protein EVAR_78983_1 [Eumeta japonica]|uniref:Uncharacterized protein n=1 Tax=Eumeta variegata TaxID=151549 RepID=A0A4C1USJ7_EUMVA|nr:hypothetical protein EVAR_78983_1 [Eumeta japonica]
MFGTDLLFISSEIKGLGCRAFHPAGLTLRPTRQVSIGPSLSLIRLSEKGSPIETLFQGVILDPVAVTDAMTSSGTDAFRPGTVQVV